MDVWAMKEVMGPSLHLPGPAGRRD
jgi:hypothetical protein